MKTKHLLKKTLLLLALIGGTTSAWADSTEDFKYGTSTSSGNNYVGTSFTIPGTYILGNGSTKSGNMTTKGQKVKCVSNGTSKVLVINVNTGKKITEVTIHANINKNDNVGTMTDIKVDGTSATGFSSSAGNIPARNSNSNGDSFDFTITDDATDNITMYFDNMGSDQMNMELFVTYENVGPAITAPATSSIKATESGVEVTEGIAVTGSNLAGSTLTATLSPAVTGLSVTLGSSTITDGAISTTATLHYTQTENASGSTTLTLSDGTTSKDVTVNYTSKVVPAELEAVGSTAITSMDLSEVGTSGMETLTTDDGYVVLSDAGATTSFADNLAVSCIDGVGVTWRSDAVQGPLFKFKTTVPGTVTLKFSDVGSSSGRANRYANVNGTRSDVYSTTSASGGVKTCSPIEVSAGEVIIKGQVQGDGDTYTDNQIRIFTITFTPYIPVTISEYGKSTFSSTSPVDIANAKPAGLKAFKATACDGSKVTMEEVTTAVAGMTGSNKTGLVLVGTPNTTYYIPIAASGTEPSGNLLFGWDSSWGETISAASPSGTNFVLSVQSGNVVWAPVISTPAPITDGQAALWADVTIDEARALTMVFDDDLTGINSVKSDATLNNGAVYNLRGQRVAQPTKGLYIVNGKKVIIK